MYISENSYYLYLAVCGDWLKFGIAADPKARLSNYKTHNPFMLKFEIVWHCTKSQAEALEAFALDCLSRIDIENRGDWHNLKMQHEAILRILGFIDSEVKRVVIDFANKKLSLNAALKRVLRPEDNFITKDELKERLAANSYTLFHNKTSHILKSTMDDLGYYRKSVGFQKRQKAL